MKRFFAVMLAMAMMGTTAYAAEEREMVKAIPQWQEVVFDGHEVVMPCYNIDGYTYLRLRDYAEKVTVEFSSTVSGTIAIISAL